MALKIQVVTPDKTHFEGEATKLVVPAWDGELGILPKHAPLIARLGHGPLRVTAPSGQHVTLAVYGGFLKVQDDDVIVLAAGVGEGKELDAANVETRYADAKKKVDASRPPKSTPGQFEETLEAYRRAKANREASKQAKA